MGVNKINMADPGEFYTCIYKFKINNLQGSKFKMLPRMLPKKMSEHYQR